MNESKKNKIRDSYIKEGLMEPDEELLDVIEVSYYRRKLLWIREWQKGWGYYTDKKLIVKSGFLESTLIINYKDIVGINKCTQFFIPIGIKITYTKEDGKQIDEIISTTKREKYLDILSSKSGVVVS